MGWLRIERLRYIKVSFIQGYRDCLFIWSVRFHCTIETVQCYPVTQWPTTIYLPHMSLQEYMEGLHGHFLEQRVETHMYSSQWFLTIYTAKFPIGMVFRVMDVYLCEVRVHFIQPRGWVELSDLVRPITLVGLVYSRTSLSELYDANFCTHHAVVTDVSVFCRAL